MLIDISKWNGEINWTKVKAAGVDGVIIRCGVGQTGVDTKFKANIENALKVGMNVGVYTYSKAKTESAAITEAKNTLKAIEPYKGKLYYPVFVDLEESGTGPYSKVVANAFTKVIKEAGYTSGIYCSSSWRKTYLSGVTAECWWIAQWSSKEPSCDIWQYSAKGKVNGISGDVDMDKNISYKPAPVPTPTPTPSGGTYEVKTETLYYRPGNIMQGQNVKSVQAIVGVTQDGKFGVKTRDAVKAYQKKYKLKQDGYWGPECWQFACGTK